MLPSEHYHRPFKFFRRTMYQDIVVKSLGRGDLAMYVNSTFMYGRDP